MSALALAAVALYASGVSVVYATAAYRFQRAAVLFGAGLVPEGRAQSERGEGLMRAADTLCGLRLLRAVRGE